MIATLQYYSKTYKIDLSKPLDISMPLSASKKNVNAWYVGKPKIKPVKKGNWIGKVKKGSDVNFNSIKFNPHAHGTHTECVGHISKAFHSVNKNLKRFFFMAEVITIAPEMLNGDFVISKKQIQSGLGNKKRDAVVLRTLPNTKEKLSMQYSNTNPVYLMEEAAVYLREKGIEHLLIDLPSVDKEKDGGKLKAHKAFWNYGRKMRKDCTITELIYVPNKVKDGTYALNLQIAPFENDATPSKPVLYKTL
ncbi:MAG TPA: cyclase family protein [Flavobacteriaceae bacterium]|nr:cyclase family protein [Flavobacteriaceae bacterium]